MGLISTNPCSKLNYYLGFPKWFFFFSSILVPRGCWRKKLLIRWSPAHHSTPPAYTCFDGQWWKRRWTRENSPPSSAPLPRQLPTPHLWFPISTGVEVCSLAAGHSGSVLTKLCLFPGLQGSQGKLGSRGETNKKAPLSRTLKWSPTRSSFLHNRGTFLFLGEEWQKETSSLETGPEDNKTAVVLSYVFFSV